MRWTCVVQSNESSQSYVLGKTDKRPEDFEPLGSGVLLPCFTSPSLSQSRSCYRTRAVLVRSMPSQIVVVVVVSNTIICYYQHLSSPQSETKP